MKQKKPWTIQWHITADGTVIRQRSRGAGEHQQLFESYSTTRTPRIAELDALMEAVQRSSASGERLSKVLLYVGYAALAGLVLGVVTTWVGIDTGFLTLGSLAVVILLSMSTGILMRRSIGRFNRAYGEAGFESPNGVTLAGREARVLIDEPGTVSGREFAAVRA